MTPARHVLGCCALICAFQLPTTVHAQTQRIVGIGAASCARFNDEVRANPAVQRDYVAWAQGFMSAVLLTRPPGVDEGLDLIPRNFPLQKQLQFLRTYCAEQPQSDFSEGVKALYRTLRAPGS